MTDKGLISKVYKEFIELNQEDKPSTRNEQKTLTDISPKKKYRWPMGFPGGTNPPPSAGNVREAGSIPGWEDLLEEGTITPSSILAWRIPRTEEPGRLYSP